jgi:hypothetical protein
VVDKHTASQRPGSVKNALRFVASFPETPRAFILQDCHACDGLRKAFSENNKEDAASEESARCGFAIKSSRRKLFFKCYLQTGISTT